MVCHWTFKSDLIFITIIIIRRSCCPFVSCVIFTQVICQSLNTKALYLSQHEDLLTSALWQWCRYSTCKSFSSALTRQAQGRCNCFRSTSSALSALRKEKKRFNLLQSWLEPRGYGVGGRGALQGTRSQETKGRSRSPFRLISLPPAPSGSRCFISPPPPTCLTLQLIIGSTAPFIWFPSQKWSQIHLELI